MKLQLLQMIQFFIECKIMVGCRLRAYPSILLSFDVETLKITVGCPSSTYPSIRTKTCGKHVSCGHARPPMLTPLLVQAFHSRACLNLHHSDIQSTAQKSPCVNTEAIAKKGLSLSRDNGHVRHQRDTHDTRDNGHVRHQRDTHDTRDNGHVTQQRDDVI